MNEGLAVHSAQAIAPGFAAAEYFGYARRQYHRLREMEAFLRRVVEPELEQSGLGLRLRYLSGGMSPTARLVGGRVLPERMFAPQEEGVDADADDAPDSAPSGDPSKVSLREMAGEQRAPWHFKLLIALVVIYLTWRIIQMISWVVT